MYYYLLIIAAMLFSLQFFCQQKYEEQCNRFSVAHLPGSVQYPFVTGGVMVFSTLISTIRHENVRKLEYIAAAIALVSTVMMAF